MAMKFGIFAIIGKFWYNGIINDIYLYNVIRYE